MLSVFVAVLLAVFLQTATPPGTPQPVHEECIAATTLPNVAELVSYPDLPPNEQLIGDISGALDPGITIDNVWVVQSEDFENVWFVGAMMHGPGFDEDGDAALWAVSSINEDGEYTGVGLIFSVNAFAVEFSNWGDGGNTDAQLSTSDDGAEEAMECAEGED